MSQFFGPPSVGRCTCLFYGRGLSETRVHNPRCAEHGDAAVRERLAPLGNCDVLPAPPAPRLLEADWGFEWEEPEALVRAARKAGASA